MANSKWILDPTHSELGFKVKHLMISNVNGSFTKFEASIDGEDFTQSTVRATIDVASIATNNIDRDNHLKSADFFDAENHSQITFTGNSFTKVKDEVYKLNGLLSIKGMTKEITLDVEYGGTNKDP